VPAARAADSVVEAVRRELAAIGKLDAALSTGAEAMTALSLARELDDAGNSATSKSMCARALTETLVELRKRAPEAKREKSKVDELRERRDARQGNAAS
jgi:hypothetical protein